MKRRPLTKLFTIIMAIIMITGFVMSSMLCVKADNSTAGTTVTLLDGRQINEALKTLAGDTIPTDNSISSLFLVKDTKITSVERTNELNNDASKVSFTSDSSVIAWLDGTVVKWYTDASTVFMNADSSYMFYGFSSLQTIKGFNTIDTSKIEDISYLFAEDDSIQYLDLSYISSIKLTNMKSAFADMTALSSLNINDISTANVTDMSGLFSNDTSLFSIDLSSFAVNAAADSSSSTSVSANAVVTNITDMFKGSSLTKIYVGYDWKSDITQDSRFIRVFSSWFNQTLVMASDTDLKDIYFTYSLTPGVSVSNSATSSAIAAGLVNSNCSISSATFTAADPCSKGTPSDASFEGKKYITKKVKILIDTAQFTEPGIYRYLVSESTPLEGVNAGLFQLDENTQRVLDVLVEYKDDSKLMVSASVLHKTQIELLSETLDVNEKSTGFDNSYLLTTNDLIIRSGISGNQGDTRKEYNYKFILDGDIAERTITVVHSDSSVETFQIDAQKHGEFSFSLKGNEKITIKDIQKRATYKITAEKEILKGQGIDVKATPTNASAEYQAVCYSLDTDASCYIMNLSVDEDVDVTFLNIKNGVVPTGIILDTAPYTLSLVMGIIGIVIIERKKKLDQMEEDIEN